jgi:hypothetical protein
MPVFPILYAVVSVLTTNRCPPYPPLAVALLISGFSNFQYGKQNSEAPSAKARLITPPCSQQQSHPH